uniref:Uncharacterized protein n=1 Tax=Trichogramma kaykai TaxID=54128 RepID=A0ABD2VT33_9HYME
MHSRYKRQHPAKFMTPWLLRLTRRAKKAEARKPDQSSHPLNTQSKKVTSNLSMESSNRAFLSCTKTCDIRSLLLQARE